MNVTWDLQKRSNAFSKKGKAIATIFTEDGIIAAKEKYPDVKITTDGVIHNTKPAALLAEEISSYNYSYKNTEDSSTGIAHKNGVKYNLEPVKPGINNLPLPGTALTKREIEIIRMAAKEYNSGEIAAQLDINVRTVETHRKRIMAKTNSKNFIGVVIFALKNNYIDINDFS